MNLNEQANKIYESTRTILLNTEPVSKEIEKISYHLLRDKLLEILRTCQADLLILNDVLIDVMNCESEEDIEFLLQAANENYLEG
ncbi:MAG: hypothetical protein ACYDEE_11015 [Ignavibacteriaceae bacterium]